MTILTPEWFVAGTGLSLLGGIMIGLRDKDRRFGLLDARQDAASKALEGLRADLGLLIREIGRAHSDLASHGKQIDDLRRRTDGQAIEAESDARAWQRCVIEQGRLIRGLSDTLDSLAECQGIVVEADDWSPDDHVIPTDAVWGPDDIEEGPIR